jgi:hypothetical protein
MTEADDRRALEARMARVLRRARLRALAVTVVVYTVGITIFLIATTTQAVTVDAWGPFAFVAWVALIPTMLVVFCLIVRRSEPFDGDASRAFRRLLYVRAGLVAGAGAGIFALLALWLWGDLG